MAHEANQLWKTLHAGDGEFLYQNNVTYIIILWGGLTTNLFWCMVLNFRNKTFKDYSNTKTPLLSNYIFVPWQAPPGFYSSFFMAWPKVSWGMVPVPGFYIWPLLFWWLMFGDWY